MAFFNLPFSVRIAGSDPIDGDRYVVADIAGRDALIVTGRAFNGLQVFVEANKTLYILRDLVSETWEEVATSGSGDKNFVFSQPVPDDFWTIIHNLGKFPSVTIYSTVGEVVEARVDYIDTNTLTISFNKNFIGNATLN